MTQCSTPETDAVVALFNGEREAVGLPPLTHDDRLQQAAMFWALSMGIKGVLSHGDFAGRISAAFSNTAAGEDVAEGQPTPEAVVAAWMASPPHRANILGDFTLAGVGYTGGPGPRYWCADFDKP